MQTYRSHNQPQYPVPGATEKQAGEDEFKASHCSSIKHSSYIETDSITFELPSIIGSEISPVLIALRTVVAMSL